MNNNRQCPVCRSPLTSSNCKKCGYQQKKLKIVETQEEFGRFNFINRVQRTHHSHQTTRRLTAEEKLKLYLRQYIKLLKSAVAKLALAYGLPQQLSLRLNDAVFQIWKGYLLRRQEMGLSIAGIFRPYISTRPKPAANKKKKIASAEQQDHPAAQSEKDLDSSQEERQEASKKRAAEQAKADAQPQAGELQIKHKFRSYYIVSVKPLIRESIEQRKTDSRSLTSCQKSFLSYLLAAEGADEQFARMCSQKYLRMLLQLSGRNNEQSYVKEGEIEQQLRVRNCGTLQKKDDCVLLILLIDLLWCFDSENFQIAPNQKLADLLAIYEKCEGKSDIIDIIVECFSSLDSPDTPNVPGITFELIYTIITLASAKVGACLTISEIIAGCGPLEIAPIAAENETFIDGVANEQAIHPTKIRKNTHLLASLLDLKGEALPSKWCEKWCAKLQLQASAKQIVLLSELIFRQLRQTESLGDGRGQFLAEGRVFKYRRHFWIEQDIACLAAIVIYVKLATGITNYPYIVNFPIKETTQSTIIQNQQMKALSQLMQNRSVLINNTSTNLLKKVIFPQIYNNQISLPLLSKTITHLSTKDKAYQMHSFNKTSIRFRNLSHLNGMGSNELIACFIRLKEAATKPQQGNEHEIHLKFEETLHKQFTRELAERYKRVKAKKGKDAAGRPTARLNPNILRQMQCIVRDNDALAEGVPVLTEECVVDEPSSNYELLYEYNQQNLALSHRTEQLYLMESLCLNLCNFSELTYWLNREQSVLKSFES